MNTECLESRLQEIAYWCKLIQDKPDRQDAISYLYVHARLLLDELERKH
ncbi:hypothetical protein ACODM8_18930 [Vibrio ostreicida]|uniref:Uncharacterized protein n=1 Tax=Vibrio ostreicida TaxID=526588 RepID=A0ABT8BQ21_9VIBR|nr:hypothetical protein [Vibrio ostreicida]MDN3608227.1 hypothetical protein [Vibrio ostreicida]NPD09786.1 hypothetical protein [Vibrio ostreicida]